MISLFAHSEWNLAEKCTPLRGVGDVLLLMLKFLVTKLIIFGPAHLPCCFHVFDSAAVEEVCDWHLVASATAHTAY